MDLKLLEDALVLLEEGNLSKAAERRHVTQPAFSRRIRALEDWVGRPLLERRANRVELLSSLVANGDEIRALTVRLEQLRQRIASGRPHEHRVVLATQHALSARVFSQVLAAFQPRLPDLSWRLRTLNREDCVSIFVRGDADLLMCYEATGLLPLPFDQTILRKIWTRDVLIPVIGRAWRERIGADGLLTAVPPLITYPADSHFGRLLLAAGMNDRFAPAEGVPLVESAFTVGILELVLAGAGLSWVPQSLCRDALTSGDLISLAPGYGRLALSISLFARRDSAIGCRLLEML